MSSQQAQKLYARCFSEEDLAYLQRQPEFIEATGKVGTIQDALIAVEVGDGLIRKTWRRYQESPSAAAGDLGKISTHAT